MAIAPRCATSAQASATSFTVSLTGWTNLGGPAGTAPVAGDIVFIIAEVIQGVSFTASQTGGTGTWTFHDTGTFNNGANKQFVTFVAYRIFDGTETGPTFSGWASNHYEYTLVAVAPDVANVVSIDVWAANQVDTAAATTHTPNAATVTTGFTDISLLFATAVASLAGTNLVTWTVPASYTSAINVMAAAGSNSFPQTTGIAYRQSQVGTVTPGAFTLEGGSTATTGTYANLYHGLVKEAPFVPIVTAPLGAGVKRTVYHIPPRKQAFQLSVKVPTAASPIRANRTSALRKATAPLRRIASFFGLTRPLVPVPSRVFAIRVTLTAVAKRRTSFFGYSSPVVPLSFRQVTAVQRRTRLVPRAAFAGNVFVQAAAPASNVHSGLGANRIVAPSRLGFGEEIPIL